MDLPEHSDEFAMLALGGKISLAIAAASGYFELSVSSRLHRSYSQEENAKRTTIKTDSRWSSELLYQPTASHYITFQWWELVPVETFTSPSTEKRTGSDVVA
jgi:hypothetical protein